MIDEARCTVAGVRKPPRNEVRGDGTQKAPRASAIKIADAEGVCRGAMRLGASNDATGGQQRLGLMVRTSPSVAVCRLALMAASHN